MTFRNACEFAELALTSNEAGTLKLAESVLEYGNNVDWVNARLSEVGITPDPRNENREYLKTWEGRRYRDLYRSLSKEARKQWRRSEMLMELLPL